MGRIAHASRRFWEVCWARHLDSRQLEQIDFLLEPTELRQAFFQQSVADQQHAWRAWDFVQQQSSDRVDLLQAALLHDIGKRHSRLSIWGRVIATLSGWLGFRTSKRIDMYLRHGSIGADELEGWGCPLLVTEFARHHHGQRPPTIDSADWELLQQSDQAGWPARHRSDTTPSGAKQR